MFCEVSKEAAKKMAKVIKVTGDSVMVPVLVSVLTCNSVRIGQNLLNEVLMERSILADFAFFIVRA